MTKKVKKTKLIVSVKKSKPYLKTFFQINPLKNITSPH